MYTCCQLSYIFITHAILCVPYEACLDAREFKSLIRRYMFIDSKYCRPYFHIKKKVLDYLYISMSNNFGM